MAPRLWYGCIMLTALVSLFAQAESQASATASQSSISPASTACGDLLEGTDEGETLQCFRLLLLT